MSKQDKTSKHGPDACRREKKARGLSAEEENCRLDSGNQWLDTNRVTGYAYIKYEGRY